MDDWEALLSGPEHNSSAAAPLFRALPSLATLGKQQHRRPVPTAQVAKDDSSNHNTALHVLVPLLHAVYEESKLDTSALLASSQLAMAPRGDNVDDGAAAADGRDVR